MTAHITRFAPSPTGLLHRGHALAALTAFEAAAAGGTFLVRIEDLDRTRSRPGYAAAILEDLAWLGLGWPTPVLRQSERAEAYRSALDTLRARGLLYPCFCTRRDIAAQIARAAEAPHEAVETPYPGSCRNLTDPEREARVAAGTPFALRLDAAGAAAQAGPLWFTELGRGPDGEQGRIAVQPERLGDIVLARKDLPAAYHLAVVVDDAFQGVTLVTRGNDLFAATHVQRLLQALLDLPETLYAHHRLVLDAAGRKFSKRDGAATLREWRANGLSVQQLREQLGMR